MSDQEWREMMLGMLKETNDKLDTLIIDFTILKTKFQTRAGIAGAMGGLIITIIGAVILSFIL